MTERALRRSRARILGMSLARLPRLWLLASALATSAGDAGAWVYPERPRVSFAQDAPNDPSANDDGSYTGASLRDIDRFCSWCQEIVTLRILEKTDQLLDDGDSSDATRRGIVWYNRWIDSLRSNYFELFDVPSQIDAAEANYAALAPGKNGEPLWQSDLCVIPTSSSSPPVSPVPPLAADELSLLTALAAGS